MADFRILDAINVYQLSNTRRGSISGVLDAGYKQRYSQLANEVGDKLLELHGRNQIVFVNIPAPPGLIIWGDYSPGRMRINTAIEPTWDRATYGTPANQQKVAATSNTMVHEAVHAVRPVGPHLTLIEGETMCRTLEVLYYRELLGGRAYTSQVTQQQHTAKLAPNFDCLGRSDAPHYDKAQLVDHCLNMPNAGYNQGLTYDFVERSIRWWGGIRNRWLTTRGYYLKLLLMAPTINATRQGLIMEILESFASQADWRTAKIGLAGVSIVEADLRRIREALHSNFMAYNQQWCRRIQAVQEKIFPHSVTPWIG